MSARARSWPGSSQRRMLRCGRPMGGCCGIAWRAASGCRDYVGLRGPGHATARHRLLLEPLRETTLRSPARHRSSVLRLRCLPVGGHGVRSTLPPPSRRRRLRAAAACGDALWPSLHGRHRPVLTFIKFLIACNHMRFGGAMYLICCFGSAALAFALSCFRRSARRLRSASRDSRDPVTVLRPRGGDAPDRLCSRSIRRHEDRARFDQTRWFGSLTSGGARCGTLFAGWLENHFITLSERC